VLGNTCLALIGQLGAVPAYRGDTWAEAVARRREAARRTVADVTGSSRSEPRSWRAP
jgi:hypothetical protein